MLKPLLSARMSCVWRRMRAILTMQMRILSASLAFLTAISLSLPVLAGENAVDDKVQRGEVSQEQGQTQDPAQKKTSEKGESNSEPESLTWNIDESDGPRKVLAGSQFRVRLEQEISSDEAESGQPVSCVLAEDLKFDKHKVIAHNGAQVLGVIAAVSHSRRTIKSYVPGKHWLDAQGRIGFSFSGLVDPHGKVLTIDALPSEKTSVIQVKKTRAQLVANKNGEYVVKYAVGKYAAMDLAIGAVGLATGPIGILTSALVSGVAGSANKNFAAGRPVEDDEQFSKKKGFIMGVERGLPGGALISGVTTSGKDLELHKGDILTVELKKDLEIN